MDITVLTLGLGRPTCSQCVFSRLERSIRSIEMRSLRTVFLLFFFQSLVVCLQASNVCIQHHIKDYLTNAVKLGNKGKKDTRILKVGDVQATPEVSRISRKAATKKRRLWGSFEFEEFKGPAIGEDAVDRQRKVVGTVLEVGLYIY